jgi:hypothetical protein
VLTASMGTSARQVADRSPAWRNFVSPPAMACSRWTGKVAEPLRHARELRPATTGNGTSSGRPTVGHTNSGPRCR